MKQMKELLIFLLLFFSKGVTSFVFFFLEGNPSDSEGAALMSPSVLRHGVDLRDGLPTQVQGARGSSIRSTSSI